MVKKREKELKPTTKVKTKTSAAANILVIIAFVLLLLNGVLLIAFSNLIAKEIQKVSQELTLKSSYLIALGALWLVLAVLAFLCNLKIKTTSKQIWMWCLFVLSLLISASGRLESALLMLIASIVYITKEVKMPTKLNETTVIIGLIVNLVLPGLGTIIAGNYSVGIIQLVLALAGVALTLTIIGIIIGVPLFIGMWIWALITGISMLKKARNKKQ